jgi:hypothetical protein
VGYNVRRIGADIDHGRRTRAGVGYNSNPFDFRNRSNPSRNCLRGMVMASHRMDIFALTLAIVSCVELFADAG